MKPFIPSKANKKFLLVLPVIGVPFLMLIFFSLGGGRGDKNNAGSRPLGLNLELPKPRFNPKQAFMDKLKVYEKAEHDSVRKQQYQRMDPYRRDSSTGPGVAREGPAVLGVTPRAHVIPAMPVYKDPKAEQLLERLDGLRQSLQQPQRPVGRNVPPASGRVYFPPTSRAEDSAGDAQIGKLNALLDKLTRIQHPAEMHLGSPAALVTDQVLPADPGVNSIAAAIADDQILVTGNTVALRILDSIRVDGRVFCAGQLVYGTVTINNDRLLVHVASLREDRNLFLTDLQVYDMDGIAGIHVPGVLSRDVAKQSADQGVNSLTILNADPSLGAQAASAGIQTVKAFAGRKVRQMRVAVKAGYQVLLRNPRVTVNHSGFFSLKDKVAFGLRPPGFAPGGPILTHCRDQGVELALRAIMLADSCLWFGLEWTNRSAITFSPAYMRWYVRDRKVFRRTAMQEVSLDPVSGSELIAVKGDSVMHSWTGFAPFALAKEKELVLEAGEKGGGRTFQLIIGGKQIIKAKDYGKAKGEAEGGSGDRTL